MRGRTSTTFMFIAVIADVVRPISTLLAVLGEDEDVEWTLDEDGAPPPREAD